MAVDRRRLPKLDVGGRPALIFRPPSLGSWYRRGGSGTWQTLPVLGAVQPPLLVSGAAVTVGELMEEMIDHRADGLPQRRWNVACQRDRFDLQVYASVALLITRDAVHALEAAACSRG